MTKKKEITEEVQVAGEATPSYEEETPSKVALKSLIESYERQNPVKYEQKKEELQAKLKNL